MPELAFALPLVYVVVSSAALVIRFRKRTSGAVVIAAETVHPRLMR